MSADVTIVLPTFERARVLRATLPSYLAQEGVHRIVLVDDGGSAENAGALSGFATSDGRVSIVRNERQMGAPRSRMEGVKAASSPYVFFAEDDAVLSGGHIRTLLAHARHTHADICGGPVVYLRSGESVEEARARHLSQATHSTIELLPTLDYRFDQRVEDDVRTPFLSALLLVRRSLFDELEFDSAFTGNAYREETDFALRAVRLGKTVVHCPHAIAFHLPRAEAPTGGQHYLPRWRYELTAILNNWRFVRRHGAYLRQAHGVTASDPTLQWRFVRGRAATIVRGRLSRLSEGAGD